MADDGGVKVARRGAASRFTYGSRWNGRERAGSVTRMQMSGAHNAVITVTDNGVSGPNIHLLQVPCRYSLQV